MAQLLCNCNNVAHRLFERFSLNATGSCSYTTTIRPEKLIDQNLDQPTDRRQP